MTKEKIIFESHKTAIDNGVSMSARMLALHSTKDSKILDYGCGTGRNIRYIRDNANYYMVHGVDILEQLVKEEPRHNIIRDNITIVTRAERIRSTNYDLILSSFVLNVIDSDAIKKKILQCMIDKMKIGGRAFIEVRTKGDVEQAKTKEKYGDGYKIKKGNSFTYQEAISKEKIIYLVQSVGFKIAKHIFNSTSHIIIVEK